METSVQYLLLLAVLLTMASILVLLFDTRKKIDQKEFFDKNVSISEVLSGTLQKKFSEHSSEKWNNGLKIVKNKKTKKVRLEPRATVSNHTVRRTLQHW